ncbi:MAG: cupredoxin domain-containing protein [Actinocatenispora sp.]
MAALLGTLGVTLTGCGFLGAHDASTHGPDSTGTAHAGPDGGQTIRVVGNERMQFVPNVIKAHTGRLRIVLAVTGATPHNLKVPTKHASTGMVQKGKTDSVEVDLSRPGRYDFLCTYHEQHGMTGVIEVS